MIRKYHNHKLQTNPWRREEEPHNNNETPGRQTKQSNQLSLPHQGDGHRVTYNKTCSRLILCIIIRKSWVGLFSFKFSSGLFHLLSSI